MACLHFTEKMRSGCGDEGKGKNGKGIIEVLFLFIVNSIFTMTSLHQFFNFPFSIFPLSFSDGDG